MSKPLGAGSSFAPDYLLVSFLRRRLTVLAADSERLGELYARLDAELGAPAQAQAMLERLRALVRWGSEDELTVRLGYPDEHARLPAVSVVMASGSENPAAATFEDVFALSHELVIPEGGTAADAVCVQRRHKLVEHSSSIQIGTWATTPEESLLVHEAVRICLLVDKQRLTAHGIRDVTFGEGGVVPDPRLRPRVGYVPMLTCTLTWDLRHTVRRRVRSRVSGSAVYSN